MVKDELTQSQVRDWLSYEASTGIFNRRRKTSNNQKMLDIAIPKKNGYAYVNVGSKSYLAHRLAFLYMEGFIPDFVDHKDRDRTNNSWENLRACSRSQNSYNAKSTKPCKELPRNVFLDKRRNSFYVQVAYKGITKSVSGIKSLELAELVANELRIELHKDFCYGD